MPISSRRCGMITKREAERLCKSFLGDNSPPKLPENFAFEVRLRHKDDKVSFYVRICKLHNHTIFHVSHFRYIMNVHGVAEGSLCHQDTTPRERNASNALFVQFSFPQTSLSSTPIVC